MNNRKGFTLIELLVTIAIIGIAVSLGTFIVLNVIKNSKEKALEVSKKSVIESANLYANEFLDDTDWVPSEDDSNTEKSCISVQWLINKGYVKEEDFNSGEENDEYKLNTSDIVILNKNVNTKDITFDAISSSVSEKTCNNLLKSGITTSSTTRSITAYGNCSLKGITRNDVTYYYKIDNEDWISTSSNSHTWDPKEHSREYKVSFYCESDEFGKSNISDDEISTNSLPTPSIDVSSTIASIDFRTDDSSLTKIYSVNGSGVRNKKGSSDYLNVDENYESSSRYISLYASDIENDIKITATNSDGHNFVTADGEIKKPPVTSVNPPAFDPSDKIGSGNWHKSAFDLSLISDNNNDTVTYYYGTNENNLDITYNKPISITSETDSIIYYAKACIGSVCSDVTSYKVKLDKTSPTLIITTKNTDKEEITVSCDDNNNTCSNSDWIRANLAFDINASDNLSGLSSNEVTFRYSPSGQTSLGELTGSSTISLDSNNKGSRTISSDGYRHYQFEICDQAGNCTTKNMKLMVDNTAPSVGVSMGYTGMSGNLSLSCQSNECTNDSWLNDYITLYFNNANDTLSGLNNDATFSYNSAYLATLDKEILGSETAVFTSSGSWNRRITGDGSRYVTLKICDNVNNCVTKEIYFNIDTQVPEVTFIGKSGDYVKFSCESLSGVKTFSSYDGVNGNGIKESLELINHYWDSSKPNITITCRNNAEIYANYTYKYSCSSSYSYCGYEPDSQPYQGGFQTANICSNEETVCGGKQKKYTNCTITSNGIVNYRVWGTYTNSTCKEIFEFVSSGK